ncbi:metal ABC transporter permease [Proteiniborus sp. MB09-C3]|uniref:metal ABC transporter permease n=1 Tax=Proteiniborus sp. MB09-C3 TaxID=3050072 RepID=UPI002553063C|nr:metal ABC transporter permease [Proteiniborus sp. MB09-C3]WIV11314.1 metal ABC transporter permease [Proteiniborus sp. MB09-C3]
MSIFSYPFMQRALFIGIIISIISSSMGLFLVLRRLSMVGDTLSHTALAGVAIGMITNIYPLYTAIVTTLAASFVVEKLRKEYKEYAELSLAIVMAAGIGAASLLISIGKNKTIGIMNYMFGSISLVTEDDLKIVTFLGIIIIAVVLIFFRALFYMTFDEADAKLRGIPVNKLNLLFAMLVAITITLSMRIVGILLISSMMTVPVATSIQIARSFKQAFIYTNIFGVLSVSIGLIASFYLDVAPGGSIVIVSLLLLFLVILVKSLYMKLVKKTTNTVNGDVYDG